ncbi:MAG TPA: endonuclease/exonuclease/phosphatase family protein [Thermoanaerobaculia bacterium]|nr:endonuclease/exonuclease/phosphatase family protein [Thermoanaerobaculia bacterium]
MTRPVATLTHLVLLSLFAACATAPPGPAGEGEILRVALFNVKELDAVKVARVDAEGRGLDPQLRAAAEIIARVRPDVLVLQEIDVPPDDPRAVAGAFVAAYLAPAGLDFPHLFTAPSNTGRLSGFDLDNDGRVAAEADLGSRAWGDDSFGFGTYPGQYGMAVVSRLPLTADRARTFRDYLWSELPGHNVPDGFYSPDELAVLPLSSKSHWDLPVEVAGRTLHLLVSHPTPPVFDGDEDRNGRRNFDEIAFWLRYLEDSPALVDDRGRRGGLAADALFVLAGDLNADPLRPATVIDGSTAIRQLLAHPRLLDPGDLLVSEGARRHGRGGESLPEQVTAGFAGGMRVDYLLPSRRLEVVDGGVFWPDPETDPQGHRLATEASDHRLLWLDLQVPTASK